ncbi:hypothetical protein SSAG_05773 [Streptomyces sp. Mg1]|nr:hypothetical protein [Streptomyces sp. Mg1]EDX25982.1 hypothetical protein SSAG_05773 [Streptomyces sp. Mg1]
MVLAQMGRARPGGGQPPQRLGGRFHLGAHGLRQPDVHVESQIHLEQLVAGVQGGHPAARGVPGVEPGTQRGRRVRDQLALDRGHFGDGPGHPFGQLLRLRSRLRAPRQQGQYVAERIGTVQRRPQLRQEHLGADEVDEEPLHGRGGHPGVGGDEFGDQVGEPDGGGGAPDQAQHHLARPHRDLLGGRPGARSGRGQVRDDQPVAPYEAQVVGGDAQRPQDCGLALQAGHHLGQPAHVGPDGLAVPLAPAGLGRLVEADGGDPGHGAEGRGPAGHPQPVAGQRPYRAAQLLDADRLPGEHRVEGAAQ